MGNIAPQDIANQIPAWSILTSAYLFRDADHLLAFFESDAGQEMMAMAEEQLGIHILGPTYFGTRQVGLAEDRSRRRPRTWPASGCACRRGEAWQFLGQALGANPAPMPYAETYTGLQTGAIDGQDNPLPNVENMKFYEVMDQIVLTSHLVGYDLLVISSTAWDAMSPEEQAEVRGGGDRGHRLEHPEHLKQEAELTTFFEEQGLTFTTPDVEAFRAHAQQMYLESALAQDWPEGMLDRINAL